MTPEQIEVAARKWCEFYGNENPTESHIVHAKKHIKSYLSLITVNAIVYALTQKEQS